MSEDRTRRKRGGASQFGPRRPHSPAVEALNGLGNVGFSRFPPTAAQSPVILADEAAGRETPPAVAELAALGVAVRNEQIAKERSEAALMLAAIEEAAAAAAGGDRAGGDAPSPAEGLLFVPAAEGEWHLQVIEAGTAAEGAEVDRPAQDQPLDQAEEQPGALDQQAAEIGRLESEGDRLRGALMAAELIAAGAGGQAEEARADAEAARREATELAARLEALRQGWQVDAQDETGTAAQSSGRGDEDHEPENDVDQNDVDQDDVDQDGDGQHDHWQDDDQDEDSWSDDGQDAPGGTGADIFAGLPAAPAGQSVGRRWPRRAAVGVGVVIAAAAAITLTSGGGQQAPVAEPAPAVSEPSVGPVTMTVWRGIGLPVSATAGPRDQGDAVGGFEQSTLGAAIAAAHLSVRLDPAAGPAVFNPVIDTHVVGDVERLRTSVARQYDAEAQAAGVAGGSPLATSPGSILAYRLDGDPAQGAVTAHLLVAADGSEADFGVPLRWEDGDWRVAATDEGPFFTVADVADASTYTPFEGTVQ